VDPDLRRLAGRVLVAGYEGIEPPPTIVHAAERGELAGVILFRRNVAEPEPLREALSALMTTSDPLLIAVDQEGGRVARLRAPVITLPPMRVLGRIDDVALTERAGRVLGAQLRAIGFNVDFAPVLDVDTNPDNPVIGDRAFAPTANAVIRHAGAFARGLARAGVIACGKHFPGHGDTELDSHFALPRLRHDPERLAAVELAPFRALAAELPMIMTAHVVFDAWDPDHPATVSRRVITDLLRDELGYQGVIVSDDLHMKAVADRYGVEDAACRAIAAGCDVLLVCQPDAFMGVRDALTARAETEPAFAARLHDAAARALLLRRRFPPKPATSFDTADARALEDEIARRRPANH
jgi:beta-N-acetylhexosaminidase